MIKKRRNNYSPRRTEDEHKINRNIRAPKVRLVGEEIDSDVYTIAQALAIAEEKGTDLVEISPNAEPPVCKLVDYKKFLYDQKKKQKQLKSKQSQTVIKELRFGPNTDEHDFKFKLNHAKKFLTAGAKVKAFVFFKGRSIVYKEQGEVLLLQLATELEDYGIVEKMPQLRGKRMIMFIAPKKKN